MELRIDPDQYARFEQALFTGRSEPSAALHHPSAPLHHAPPARHPEAPAALAHRKAAGCGVRVWGCDTSSATHPDAAEAPESILRDTTALSSMQQQSPGRDAFALLPSPGPPCVPQALRAQLRPRDAPAPNGNSNAGVGGAAGHNYSVLSAASTTSTASSAARLRTPPRAEADAGTTAGVLPAAVASATLSAAASPPSVSPIAQLGSAAAATTTDTLHGRMARLIAALDRVGPPPQQPETPPPPQQHHYRHPDHHALQQQPRPVTAPTAELRAREVSCPRCHFCWMEGGGPVESAGAPSTYDTVSAVSPPRRGSGSSSSGGAAAFGAVGAASAPAAGYDVVSLGSPPPPQRRVAHASPAPPETPPGAAAAAASPLPPAVAAPAYAGMQFNESLPATPLPQPAQAKAPRVHRQPLLMSPMAAEPHVPVCEAAWDDTTPSHAQVSRCGALACEVPIECAPPSHSYVAEDTTAPAAPASQGTAEAELSMFEDTSGVEGGSEAGQAAAIMRLFGKGAVLSGPADSLAVDVLQSEVDGAHAFAPGEVSDAEESVDKEGEAESGTDPHNEGVPLGGVRSSCGDLL